MHLSSDELILWQHGFFKLNATIVTTWALMLVLAVGAKLVTRNLAHEVHISRWQSLLEIVVTNIRKQIEEVGLRQPEKYLGFLGTLFLFIALSNLCTIFPGYEPPTGSLSTTAALALCVFVAVPVFGIAESGWSGYLRSYRRPTVVMLPFNTACTERPSARASTSAWNCSPSTLAASSSSCCAGVSCPMRWEIAPSTRGGSCSQARLGPSIQRPCPSRNRSPRSCIARTSSTVNSALPSVWRARVWRKGAAQAIGPAIEVGIHKMARFYPGQVHPDVAPLALELVGDRRQGRSPRALSLAGGCRAWASSSAR